MRDQLLLIQNQTNSLTPTNEVQRRTETRVLPKNFLQEIVASSVETCKTVIKLFSIEISLESKGEVHFRSKNSTNNHKLSNYKRTGLNNCKKPQLSTLRDYNSFPKMWFYLEVFISVKS